MAKITNEEGIRKYSPPTIGKILDTWKTLSINTFDQHIPVCVAGRRDVPELAGMSGDINIAYPIILENRVCLLVVVNDMRHVPPAVMAHEISHWILKLRGFKGVKNDKNPTGMLAAHINDYCQHILVWDLVEEHDISSREEIDSRIANDIQLLLNIEKEPEPKIERSKLALIVADDLNFCDENSSSVIQKIISNKCPKTAQLIKQLQAIQAKYDLYDSSANSECIKEIQKLVAKEGSWRIPDEIESINKKIVKTKNPFPQPTN